MVMLTTILTPPLCGGAAQRTAEAIDGVLWTHGTEAMQHAHLPRQERCGVHGEMTAS